ncbi:MAG: FAD-dependent oxidoreductase [Kiritimatiellae bacterium]|nr:FAD-dependent oxidoreductase [Kiritimatiellia bacterium]
MSQDRERVVIIGGGVIAISSAYYLAKAGYQVTLLERNRFGSGCSESNCGFICPSHILPLCEPGARAKTLKTMLQKDSPFRVNPFVGPPLWGWMLRFMQRCRYDYMIEAAKARHALLESSMRLYHDLMNESVIDCEWKSKGLLFVFKSDKAMDDYIKTNDLIEDQFGLGAKPYDSKALAELEPSLKPGLAGGWLHEHDAHLRPDLLMSSWRASCEALGVEVIENCEAQSFTIESGKIVAVETSTGSVPASKVLLATGALAPKLAKMLGRDLYIQPGKGYSITTSRPDPCPEIPMIFVEHSVAATPFDDRYRLGSTMEFTGYDDRINRKRLGLLERGASHYLKQALGDTVHQEWCGWRPMAYNGIPTISQSKSVSNAFIAAGHSMLGVSMAPATGKLISEIITGDTPHIAADPYG